MDYTYIEQLLERYWEAETSVEEEQVLRAFYAQNDVPMHLQPYRMLFLHAQQTKQTPLSAEFDERIMAAIQEPPVKAVAVTFRTRFSGLYRAVAIVAVICLLGGVGHQMFFSDTRINANGAAVNSTLPPQVAEEPTLRPEQVSKADTTSTHTTSLCTAMKGTMETKESLATTN